MTCPNFIVIGVAKAGTTSLYHYLLQHPQIFLPAVRESHYFASCDKPFLFSGPWEKYTVNRQAITSWRGYLDLYKNAGSFAARGEICPSYIRTPGTASRMREKLHNVKIIAVLRDPVDRAFSEYNMRRGLGVEELSFNDALAAESTRIERNWYAGDYFRRGLYSRQLEEYYAAFPREDIKIILFDEFVGSTDSVLNDLCKFLSVSEMDVWNATIRHNISGDITNPVLKSLWTQTNTVRGLIRPFLPMKIRNHISAQVNKLPRTRPVLDPQTGAWLRERYVDDIRACEQITGVSLQRWNK